MVCLTTGGLYWQIDAAPTSPIRTTTSDALISTMRVEH